MSLNVKADNLSKSYGDVLAVDNITIEVSSGSIVGFLGPNGAGKTTTLKMLTGLLKPDKGIVNICGHNIQIDSVSAKSKLGYVPDIPHLYEKLTPIEFLNFIADVFKIDKKIAQNRIADLVELFDLGDHLKKLNSSLSHGNKQKVSLAAAILHRPDVLLLDEPTGGLDPRVTRKIKDIILQLARDGCAILFYIINKGRIVAKGDINSLKESAESESSLEELFIELTGGSEYNEVINYLRN
jgi:ABC-2 type transport system ATP-binding protein